MNKITKWAKGQVHKYGWLAMGVLIADILVLAIIFISSIITPFLNSIIWGMD